MSAHVYTPLHKTCTCAHTPTHTTYTWTHTPTHTTYTCAYAHAHIHNFLVDMAALFSSVNPTQICNQIRQHKCQQPLRTLFSLAQLYSNILPWQSSTRKSSHQEALIVRYARFEKKKSKHITIVTVYITIVSNLFIIQKNCDWFMIKEEEDIPNILIRTAGSREGIVERKGRISSITYHLSMQSSSWPMHSKEFTRTC